MGKTTNSENKKAAKNTVTTPKKAVKKTAKKTAKSASAKVKKTAKAQKAPEKREFLPHKHMLVPKHEICSEQEISDLHIKYSLQPTSLPTILLSDPGIKHLGAKIGDIIKITRSSLTAGTATYYRRVSNE